MSTKVSVVVPVYNAESYVAECLDSLINQSLEECEFIFVNDGSTDHSKQIIEEYQRGDSRIILLNQPNQGVSAARNAGLLIAEGEYVGFVDADDYIMKDMYYKHYQTTKLTDCDVVISNFRELHHTEFVIPYPFPLNSQLDKEYIDHGIIPHLLGSDNCNSVCNKLYRNELIKKYNIQFPNNISLGEDGMFNLLFMCFAQTAKYINYAGYCYREVKGSATRNIMEKDYFTPAIEMYSLNHSEKFPLRIQEHEINRLKSTKLIYSVMSYVHLYFTPTKEVPFNKRYKYIKRMINHMFVKEAIEQLPLVVIKNMGRYERVLLFMIKKEMVLGLLSLVSYSRLRNQ